MEVKTVVQQEKTPLGTKYCDTFWNNFDVVVKEIEMSRGQLKQYMNLIESRIKIENMYAEKLLQLSKVEQKPNRSGLSHQLVNMYSASLKKKSDQTKNFSNLLLQTGLDKLYRFFDTSGTNFKTLKEQGKGYQKQLQVAQQDYKKISTKLDKRKKQLEQLQLQYLVASTSRQFSEKKASLSAKIKEKVTQYNELRKQCKQYYSTYSKIQRSFEKSIKDILFTFYELQADKLDRMIDSFINIQLVESSECKNRFVYLENESKFINSITATGEIEKIISNFQGNNSPQLPLMSKASFKQSFLDITFERLSSKKIQQIMKYGDTHKISIRNVLQNIEQQMKQITAEALSIAIYIKKMWTNSLCSEDVTVFDQHINSPFLRKDFVICLQQQRILGKFQISQQKLESVVNTIDRVLNKCFQQKDSYTAKHILVLIFTYFTNIKQGQTTKKQYLHSFLKSNQIWKTIEFWQSALIQSLYQQSKGTQDLTTLNLKGININNQKQQNLVFNQLAYYVYNMMLFDLQQKQVKQFAIKFIKLYNMDDSLSKQIFDTITRAKLSQTTKTPQQSSSLNSTLNGIIKVTSSQEINNKPIENEEPDKNNNTQNEGNKTNSQ